MDNKIPTLLKNVCEISLNSINVFSPSKKIDLQPSILYTSFLFNCFPFTFSPHAVKLAFYIFIRSPVILPGRH